MRVILANPQNYGAKRDARLIRYLVFHYTANDGDTAEANGRYFRNNVVKASAHYFVDDTEVVQSVPDNYVAWAVGGGLQGSGGHTMHRIITNTNSLSVELCDTRRNGFYDFTEETLSRAAALGRELMEKYGIPPENVYCHFDVTGKRCPGIPSWIDGDRPAWRAFKERLEDMTGKEIFDKLNEYMEGQEAPAWAKAELDEAVAAGITDGTKPMTLIPRYQAALMALRAQKGAQK